LCKAHKTEEQQSTRNDFSHNNSIAY
jgi:hypothetical protein